MKTLTKRLLAVLTALTMLGTLGITALAESTEVDPLSKETEFRIAMNNTSGKEAVTKDPTSSFVRSSISPVFPFDLTSDITDDKLAKLLKAELQCKIVCADTSKFTVSAVPITDDDKTAFNTEVYTALKDATTIEDAAACVGKFWGAGGGTIVSKDIDPATIEANEANEKIEETSFDVTNYVKTETDGLYFIKLYTASTKANKVRPPIKLVLTFSDALGDLNSISIPATVTGDFKLPTTGTNGSKIEWASSDASTIAIDGSTARVTRPLLSDGNKTVTLTATATLGTDVQTRDFTVTVLCSQNVSENIVRAVATADTYVNNSEKYSGTSYSKWNYLDINGSARHSFLRFNVENTANIQSAAAARLYMRINSTTGTPTINVFGLKGTDRTSWVEDGLTYNALPEGIVDRGDKIDTVPTERMIAEEWVSVDITSYLKENCASDGIAAFRLWGYPNAKIDTRETEFAPYIELYSGDKGAVIADTDAIKLPSYVFESFTIPTAGANGSTIEWASDNAAITVSGGTAAVTPVDADTEVTLTATISKGVETDTKAFKVKVLKEIFKFSGALTAETVTVSVANGYVMPSENVIYIAKYDTEGQLIGMASLGEAITVTEELKEIKAFMWKKDSLRPISMGILSK